MRLADFPPAEVWWVLNQPRGEQDRQDANRNVDEENPAPAEIVRDPPSQRGTDRRSGDDCHSVDGECHPSFRRGKSIRQNSLLAGLQAAATDSL